jgi:hypothetical protein
VYQAGKSVDHSLVHSSNLLESCPFLSYLHLSYSSPSLAAVQSSASHSHNRYVFDDEIRNSISTSDVVLEANASPRGSIFAGLSLPRFLPTSPRPQRRGLVDITDINPADNLQLFYLKSRQKSEIDSTLLL